MTIRSALALIAFVTSICGVASAAGDGMPSSFPLPMYHEDGASNVQYHTDKESASLQYDVNDDMKDVVAWYRDRLQAQGFKIMADQEFKDSQGITRGMVAWNRCEGHAYSGVQVGSVAGQSSGTPFAEITLQANKSTGC